MANVAKKWIGTFKRKVVDGTEYTFTARNALTVSNATHRAELKASGCFSESGSDLTYTGRVRIPGDDGALYLVDASGDLTVDDANISAVPSGEIEDPA